MRLHLVHSFRSTLARVHRDQRGAVSLETVLIIAAVALPVLIFVVKYGWPFVRDSFTDRQELLEIEADRTKDAG
jgi:Flp pilus assembly pilin Flp